MSSKVGIVSGASSGIGRGVAVALAELGCAVVVNYRSSEQEAQRTAELVRSAGAEAFLCQADVSRTEDCRRLVGETLKRWERLDYLVNNAGTTTTSPFEEINEEEWDRIFQVNVKGAFFLTQAAHQALKARNGSIVNVSSVAGFTGVSSSIPYSASKAAMNNLTISLSQELAPEVRVNGVAPGFVETPWGERYFGERLGSIRKFVKSRTATGKVNQTEDVVEAVMSLLTGLSQVTGQTLVIDGGYR